MNVSAVDKTTGKSNKMMVTNDRGSLSREDIEAWFLRRKRKGLSVRPQYEGRN